MSSFPPRPTGIACLYLQPPAVEFPYSISIDINKIPHWQYVSNQACNFLPPLLLLKLKEDASLNSPAQLMEDVHQHLGS